MNPPSLDPAGRSPAVQLPGDIAPVLTSPHDPGPPAATIRQYSQSHVNGWNYCNSVPRPLILYLLTSPCIQNLASKRISRLLKVFKVYEAADEYVDMFVVSCEDKNPQTETRKQKRTRGHLPSLGRCN